MRIVANEPSPSGRVVFAGDVEDEPPAGVVRRHRDAPPPFEHLGVAGVQRLDRVAGPAGPESELVGAFGGLGELGTLGEIYGHLPSACGSPSNPLSTCLSSHELADLRERRLRAAFSLPLALGDDHPTPNRRAGPLIPVRDHWP